MTPRLLILSDCITPPSYSPRLTVLIRHLTGQGWQCTLATDNLAGQEYTTNLCRQINMTYLPAGISPVKRFFKRLADKLFQAREKQFTNILSRTFNASDFDAIFCSTYYYFPLYTAAALSKKWDIPFVADLRDIVEQWGKTPYFHTPLPKLLGLEKRLARIYERHNIKLRNRVLRMAATVTTVSPWHQTTLQKITKAPVLLIYNGFDEQEIQPVSIPSDHFNITFIGRLINLQARQPDMLFDAVGQLIQNHKINATDIRLNFYCEPEWASALRKQAALHHADKNLYIYPFVARTDIQQIMAVSSVLLALGAPASYQQHGILGTKVFEAIGAEKPFMLIPSDEDALAQLIHETGIGIAARDTEDIKAFIGQEYQVWRTDHYTHRSVSNKQLYTRGYQASQFTDIFKSLIQHA